MTTKRGPSWVPVNRAQLRDQPDVDVAVRDSLAREIAFREECAFLGVDPDEVRRQQRRLRARVWRWWRYHMAWRPRQYRELVAKRIAPWLLTEPEAWDRYERED